MIMGPNGSGKSNVLEGVGRASSLQGYRRRGDLQGRICWKWNRKNEPRLCVSGVSVPRWKFRVAIWISCVCDTIPPQAAWFRSEFSI